MGTRYFATTIGNPPKARGMIRRVEDAKTLRYERFDHKKKAFVSYPQGADVDAGNADNTKEVTENEAKGILASF